MSAFSNTVEDAILNHYLRNIAIGAPPATVYVALYTSDPGETNSGTEVSGNAYARQAVTFNAPSSGACTNSADITFPEATPAGWGTVTHFAIFNAATAGTMLFYGALTTSKTVSAGDIVRFKAGQLSIALD